MADKKLIPIYAADIQGETIKEMFFMNVAGGEKTFMIFQSGKVLILPVYRECPVQLGNMADLSEDMEGFLQIISTEIMKLAAQMKRIEELKNDLDSE